MLTMEETFIVTYICIILIGVALGLLGSWLVKKGDDKNKEDKS